MQILMKMLQLPSYGFFLLLILSSSASGAEVTSVTPISLGLIDLHPAGDTVIIDAKNGEASPTSIRSIITGGGSGRIIVTSSDVEQFDIDYPPSITLSDGENEITITDIPLYSEKSAGLVDLPGGGISVAISVGGRLVLPRTTVHSSYSGSMPITLTFQ